MHFGALILTAGPPPTDEAIEEAMMPHIEEDGGFWDWYQIGARFSGWFDDYDPNANPANHERCRYCTVKPGFRLWPGEDDGPGEIKPCNGCNTGEEAKKLPLGMCVKWPTEWAQHPGDRITVAQLQKLDPKKALLYYLVNPDGESMTKQTDPDRWPQTVAAQLEAFPDAYATVVDCHV